MARTKVHGEYLDPSVISAQTEVTAVGSDHMLIFDATDNALKKALLSDLIETVGSTPTFTGLTVNSSEVLFDNTSGDFTLKLNTNAVSDKNEIIMGDTGTPLAKFGVGGTANDIITGSDGQDFNIGTAGGGRAINFSTDNFASVEMKLDGGNLLVGKTSNTLSAAGAKLGTGGSNFTRDSNEVVYVNRTTDDGSLITLAKDGSPVGSIASQSGGIVAYLGSSYSTIGAGDTGIFFSPDNDNIIPVTATSSSTRDNAIDLGSSSGRFKDLYLSGKAKTVGADFSGQVQHLAGNVSTYFNAANARYGQIFMDGSGFNIKGWTSNGEPILYNAAATGASHRFQVAGAEKVRITNDGLTFNGDTAAANALDDYEEGTWTVSLTPSVSGSITINSGINTMKYTKVGRLVTITGRVNISSISSPTGGVRFNLPFTTSNTGQTNSNYAMFLIVTHGIDTTNTTQYVMAEAGNNTTQAEWREVTDNADWPIFPATNLKTGGGQWFYINGSYTTA